MSEQLPAEPIKSDTLIATVEYEVDANLIASMIRDNQQIPGATAIPIGDRWGVFIPFSEDIRPRIPSLMHYAAGANDAIGRTLGRVTEMKRGDDE